ncbi:MAG: hypothetical protein WCG92_04800 [Hyphomicrobiales bacterium]
MPVNPKSGVEWNTAAKGLTVSVLAAMAVCAIVLPVIFLVVGLNS